MDIEDPYPTESRGPSLDVLRRMLAAASQGADGSLEQPHVGRPHASLVRTYDEWCYLAFARGQT
ncbi:MAG: hypothetical protein ABI894_16250 [Ilumatobacteraceae bacterium]